MYEFGEMRAAFEVNLMSLVKKYPLLYDVSSPKYNDQAKKDEAWAEIARVMTSTAYDCKVKWTRLRDNYRKARLNRQKYGITSNRAIKYEKELSFLGNRFIVKKRHKPTLAMSPTEAVDSESSQHSKPDYTPMPVLETVSTLNEVNIPNNQALPSKSVHEINVFFEGIAETVKNFPKKMQIQLKRNIFNMVNDMEASLLEEEEEEEKKVGSCSNARSQEEDNSDYIATQYSDDYAISEQNVLNTVPHCEVTIVKDEIDID